MNFLRKHWYDLGGFLSIIVLGFVYAQFHVMTDYQIIIWLNLATLTFHQLEEYRIAGTFPGMVNKVLFKSKMTDRYPLNTNTAFFINVAVGWGFYLLAAILAERAIWLGIAVMLISLGNVIAHTFLFNIKGKTFYNAGLLTCWLFFVPFIYLFLYVVYHDHLITMVDYYIGIPLGIVLNVLGILKMIDWMADKNTPYIFEQRNLLPMDRESAIS